MFHITRISLYTIFLEKQKSCNVRATVSYFSFHLKRNLCKELHLEILSFFLVISNCNFRELLSSVHEVYMQIVDNVVGKNAIQQKPEVIVGVAFR